MPHLLLNQDLPLEQSSSAPPLLSPRPPVGLGGIENPPAAPGGVKNPTIPPPAAPSQHMSSKGASQESIDSGDSTFNSFAVSNSLLQVQDVANSETYQPSIQHILIWCQELENDRDFIYHTPEQSDQAWKLYLG